jgi:serine/threonine-protein kinase
VLPERAEDAEDDLPAGVLIAGRFVIVRTLGRGGMATVYEAWHQVTRRPVALKIANQKLVNNKLLSGRFLREARTASTIRHAHAIEVSDVFETTEGRPVMVMELLEGRDLAAAIRAEGRLGPREVADIFVPVLSALAHAHAEGIVHRDMKPDNIWLLPDRSVKVLDFGLARAWDVESTIGADATMGHMLVGTPHYSQPEQILTGVLSPASDVYSLGVLLYELLTGRTPLFADRSVGSVKEEFESQPLKWLLAHQKNEVVPLERYPEGAVLPEKLRALVMSTLAKEPEKRPPNAGVLANWLGWILHHELGAESGANLRVTYPSGDARELRVLPGVHKVGVGRGCGIKLADADHDTAYATLEWAGVPYEAELVPLVVDGTVKINGHVLDYRVRLVAGTQMDMGAFRLELRYPETMSPAS